MFLLRTRDAGYRELVEHLDGEYSEAGYNKARNLVRAMKLGGWLEGEPGHWRLRHGPSGDAAQIQIADQAEAEDLDAGADDTEDGEDEAEKGREENVEDGGAAERA